MHVYSSMDSCVLVSCCMLHVHACLHDHGPCVMASSMSAAAVALLEARNTNDTRMVGGGRRHACIYIYIHVKHGQNMKT